MHCPIRVVSSAMLAMLLVLGLGLSAPGAEDYAQLLAQWTSLNGEIDAAYQSLRRAPLEEREKAKTQYVQLVQRASDEVLPKLRAAAIEAYQKAPNEDKDLAKLLVGLAANDSRHEQHEQALQIARLLIDHNCPIRAIYGLGGFSAYCLDDFDTAETYLQMAQEKGSLDFQGTQLLDDIPTAKKAWQQELLLRGEEAKADDLPRVKLTTSKGDIVIELFENEAPQTVANFINLVEQQFYDGLTFHRVIGGFMAQAGCPKGDGTGDPGYKIYCECYQDNHRNHFRGSLSMAKSSDPMTNEPLANSGGSQFFLTFRRTHNLDGQHTVFGRVIEGWDVLPQLRRRARNEFSSLPLPPPDTIEKAEVLRKRDHQYVPTKVELPAENTSSPEPAADSKSETGDTP